MTSIVFCEILEDEPDRVVVCHSARGRWAVCLRSFIPPLMVKQERKWPQFFERKRPHGGRCFPGVTRALLWSWFLASGNTRRGLGVLFA